jgi:hypothetical protein
MPEIKISEAQKESITKALQCSDLLLSDIRQAHKRACQESPILELILRDILTDGVRMNARLAELDGCCR